MNNRWCFSRPKLTHAQPEIYLKNHVKTHPCNPFMLLHMRHNGIAAAGDGAQIFHWKKKKTPLHVAHTAWWLSVARPCHSWPPTTLRLLGQGPNSLIFFSLILHFSHTISLLPLIFLSFFNNKCWIEEGINRKRSE